ncbi:hypothetical protein DEO72_LG5g3022 [Vigna unguiculata]|uniref:Uncharacterized protein n=1 Tax=Vigna unguiculata TaxID=3917 RepID=A0A4D6M185_VIGUN|nr:hypothetical protein DEO72_LG5g3022 [Vigna unguiculata]
MHRSPSNIARRWRGNVIACVILLQPSVVELFFDFRSVFVIDLSLPSSHRNIPSAAMSQRSIWQRCME